MPNSAQTALKKKARDVKQAAFIAEDDLRCAKAIGDTKAAAAAESKLRKAQTEYAAILTEQRALKEQKKRDAESNRAITVADLNEAVSRVLTAIAGLSDKKLL